MVFSFGAFLLVESGNGRVKMRGDGSGKPHFKKWTVPQGGKRKILSTWIFAKLFRVSILTFI